MLVVCARITVNKGKSIMQNYFALAAPQLAGTGIDTSPLRNALNDYAQAQRQAKQDQIAAQDRQEQRTRQLRADQRAEGELLAKQSLAADQLTDPAARQAALERILARHPDRANLSPIYTNPDTAFKAIAADWGMFRDPYEQKKNQLELRKTEAEIAKLNREGLPGKDEYGLNVVTGLDAQGNPVALQATKSGKLIPSQMPEGYKFSPAFAAEQKETGKLQAGAKSNLSEVKRTAGQFLSTLDAIEQDQNLENVLGPFDSRTPNIFEGSSNVQGLINQASGLSFLQAYSALRGAGGISEKEGEVAGNAVGRLKNQNVSKEDYKKAINDLRKVITNGVIKTEIQAGLRPKEDERLLYNFETPGTSSGDKLISSNGNTETSGIKITRIERK